jgi:hypothetical protein
MKEVSLNVSASESVGKGSSKHDEKNKWVKDGSTNQHGSSVGSVGNGSSIGFGSPTQEQLP